MFRKIAIKPWPHFQYNITINLALFSKNKSVLLLSAYLFPTAWVGTVDACLDIDQFPKNVLH